MARFEYSGRDTGGAAVKGVLDAPTRDAAASQLFAKGVTPLEIDQAREQLDVGDWLKRQLARNRLGRDELILFCRQCYSLTKAGVPIIRGLMLLAEATRSDFFKVVILDVTEDLESGRDLAGALARHPKVFGPLFVSMIRVGEESGRLEEAFLRLYEYLELEQETVKSVKSALRYPTLVVSAIVIAIWALMTFVIPVFADVFARFDMELPLPTRIIMALSSFFLTYWYLVAGGFLGTVFGLRHYLHTEKGRLWWDEKKLRLPKVGGIIVRGTLARFSRAFSMAFKSGVPILQALSVVSRAMGNEYLSAQVLQMRAGIERGESLSRTAKASGVFTPLVLQMLNVGDETGRVDEMLEEVAEFYEREVKYDVKHLSSLIEPIMTVAVGFLVFVLALGVFLPMWNLTQIAAR